MLTFTTTITTAAAAAKWSICPKSCLFHLFKIYRRNWPKRRNFSAESSFSENALIKFKHALSKKRSGTLPKDTDELYRLYVASQAHPDHQQFITLSLQLQLLRVISRAELSRPRLCWSRVNAISQDIVKQRGHLPQVAWPFLLTCAARTHSFDQVEQLWTQLVSTECIQARTRGEGIINSAWHARMRAWSLHGKHWEAAQLKEQVSQPNASTFHLAGVAYSRAGFPDLSEKILQEMKGEGWKEDSEIWREIIRAHFRSNRIDKAESTAAYLLKHGTATVATWNTLLKGYVDTGWLDKARRIWEEMPKDLASWNIRLRWSLKEPGEPSAITSLLEEMQRSCSSPNIVTFGIIINYFVKMGDFASAWEWYDSMQLQYKVQPNMVVLNSLLPACANSAVLKARIFKDMQTFKLEQDLAFLLTLLFDKKSMLPVNVLADLLTRDQESFPLIRFTVLLDRILELPDKEEAAWTALSILQHAPSNLDLPAYTNLIRVFGRAGGGNSDGVDQVYCKFLAQEPQLKPDLKLLSALVDAHVKSGRIQKAEYALQELKRQQLVPSLITLTPLAQYHAQHGDLMRMEQVFQYCEQVFGSKLSIEAWTIRADAHANFGNPSTALAMLRLAQRENVADAGLFLAVVKGCLRIGNLTKAMELRQEMRNLGLKETLQWYAHLSRALARNRQYQEAMATFISGIMEITTLSKRSYHLVIDNSELTLWNRFLSGLCQSDKGMVLATRLFQSMQGNSIIKLGERKLLAPSPNLVSIRIMLGGCVKHGQFTQGYGIYQGYLLGCVEKKQSPDPIIAGLTLIILRELKRTSDEKWLEEWLQRTEVSAAKIDY